MLPITFKPLRYQSLVGLVLELLSCFVVVCSGEHDQVSNTSILILFCTKNLRLIEQPLPVVVIVSFTSYGCAVLRANHATAPE